MLNRVSDDEGITVNVSRESTIDDTQIAQFC